MSAAPAHLPTNEVSHRRMLDAARKRLPNPDDAEDVVQEAYILLLEGRSDHPYHAVRRAAKEWRSRLYGRARDGSKTRVFVAQEDWDAAPLSPEDAVVELIDHRRGNTVSPRIQYDRAYRRRDGYNEKHREYMRAWRAKRMTMIQ